MKLNPKKARKAAEKAVHDLSPTALKYGFRISCPNGYFPEDVDNLILKLEADSATLTKDNIKLKKEYDELLEEHNTLKSEFMKMKMSLMLMEVPDVTAEESIAMISKMSGISDEFSDELPTLSEEEIARRTRNSKRSDEIIANVAEPTLPPEEPTPFKTAETPTPQVFNDLLGPRKKKNNQGGN